MAKDEIFKKKNIQKKKKKYLLQGKIRSNTAEKPVQNRAVKPTPAGVVWAEGARSKQESGHGDTAKCLNKSNEIKDLLYV